ncbi:MAG: ABC transporter ATP-binding protein [Armatimonas sp.]
MSLIEARDLTRTFRRGAEEVHALAGVSFDLTEGEFLAIVGPSGSGKSTLLQLLGAMDLPTSGSLKIGGQELSKLSDGARTRLRRDTLGFVFQDFGLLPVLTVEENIALPAKLSGGASSGESAQALLERVGLGHRRYHRPHQLSGGEMQRVAIARALIRRPKILLADEPTGNLDSASGAGILMLLRELHERDGITVIVVTHNEDLAASAARRMALQDGKIVRDETRLKEGVNAGA